MIKYDIFCSICGDKIDQLTFSREYDSQAAAMLIPDAIANHEVEKGHLSAGWGEKVVDS